ncbi:MAG: glycosyltransferase 61 family protein [Pseudomonadota bacterium]
MDKSVARNETLSLDAVPDPRTETLAEAVIAPMLPGDDMACGVFRDDGSFCQISRTLISANRFTATCARPEPQARLPGRHLFAGVGRHHFGHFLLECVSRLWASEDADYDGLVIIPKRDIDFEAVFRRRFAPFLDLLTGGLPVYLVRRPLQVETLVVPTQGIGHLRWSQGTERFRRFARSRVAERIMPNGPDLLYVSRRQLKREEQMVDQEERIEALMTQSGYEVFHPQKHSLEEQSARYRAASHIVGADGSAFHLAPFAISVGTTLGLIQRRNRPEIVSALTSQIRAFCDVDLVTINALANRRESDLRDKTHAPIDFDLLKKQLEDTGLI